MSDALTILADLDRLGVKVELRGDRLHLDAPAGVLTPDLLARLKAHKPDLLRLLGERYESPPIVRAALEAFPDAEVETFTTPPAYRASNPSRQRVVDLLHPIEQRDPVKARDLADAWMERIAICTIDGGLSESDAEEVAYRELVEAMP